MLPSHFLSLKKFDTKSNNIIKLKEPWNHGKIEKGTKLSETQAYEGTYNYGVLPYGTVGSEWTTYSNILYKAKTNNGQTNMKYFRPGVKYVRPIILINYTNLSNVTTDIKDILFQEIE